MTSRIEAGTVEQRGDGLKWLVVRAGWSDQLAELVNSGKVDGVELNAAKGSWGQGLGFLAQIPRLQHLTLIDLQERDVRPIQGLSDLRSLTLSAYATSSLDFSNFPSLTKAFIEWRQQYQGLNACTELQELYVNKYDSEDLRALDRLTRLRSLSIGDSRRVCSLDGIGSFLALRSLGLFALPRLSSLMQVDDLAETLEDIDLNQCRRLSTLDPLGGLRKLRRLILADCGRVASLRPIADLPLLEELYFYGDTYVIDGDVAFLRTMRLKSVAFQNRRHYALRREDLPGFAT